MGIADHESERSLSVLSLLNFSVRAQSQEAHRSAQAAALLRAALGGRAGREDNAARRAVQPS